MPKSCTEPTTYNSSSADYLAYKKWRTCKSFDNDSVTINGSTNVSPLYNINYIPLIGNNSSSVGDSCTTTTSTNCTTTTTICCSGTIVDCSGTLISGDSAPRVVVDDYRTIIYLNSTNLGNSSYATYFSSATPPNTTSCAIICYEIQLNTIIHITATIISTIGSNGSVFVSAQNINNNVSIIGGETTIANLINVGDNLVVSLDGNNIKISVIGSFQITGNPDSCSAKYSINTISL